MKLKIFLSILLFQLCQLNITAQEKQGPTSINRATKMTIVPSLASRSSLIPAKENLGEAKDKKSGKNIVVYGKGLPNGDDPLIARNKSTNKINGRTPSIVFDGASSNSQPTDPAGAVGPNHYVLVFNTGFRIFDKLGTPLTGQLDTSNIFPSSGCCDLTCAYDTQAQRFIMTFLGNGVQVAVSQTSDPLNDGWNVYDFPMNTDYQKLSVWSDGYYLTANKDSGQADTSEVVYALERTKMLSGDPSAQIIGFPLPGIVTSGFYSPQAFNVTSSNFPAAGNVPIVYMQDDAWAGVSQDHLKLWTINVNWTVPANSNISSGQTLVTTPFTSVFDGGSFVNLPQPSGGTFIDALQATIMNQVQFRKFPSHNAAVLNFVVDIDGTAAKLAAVRWYELRQDGDGLPWSIYQEGTYSAPNQRHAWMASMGIDIQGNIAMGYTGMGGLNNQVVSTYYTGRYANDPLGSMTITETLIANGNANIPGTRYGDYGQMSIDPSDDKSFWFVGEYMNSGRKDVVGVLKIAPDFNNDIGIVNITNPNDGTLSNNEAITVSIFNYGQNVASNFPVSYQIDGGSIITEVFTGSIASGATAQFIFTTTANLSTVGQTYIITSNTSLSLDEDTSNDSFTKNVIHLNPRDLGVSAVIAPVSGTGLSASESITVVVNNYGGQAQSNFPISYNLNGTIVNEIYTGTLGPNSNANYTFTQTGDFTAIGNYQLACYTTLSADSNAANDSVTVNIIKSNCQASANCTLGDGFRLFQLGTINNVSGCGSNGYSDFTNLSTILNQGSTNDLTMSTGYGDQIFTVWIDFNDDFVFSNDEKVVNNYEIASGQGSGSYTETTSLSIPLTGALGEHLMRAKSNWNNFVLDDSCADTTYGETEDYSVTIISPALGTEEISLTDTQLNVINLKNNLFEISLEHAEFNEPLILTVYSITGQRLVYHRVEKSNGKYSYGLDLSYASAGVYLVRLGNEQFGKVKKIIVQ
jgi:hypothetical protein